MSTFGTRSSFRVSSEAKAVKGLEKSTREGEPQYSIASTKEQVS